MKLIVVVVVDTICVLGRTRASSKLDDASFVDESFDEDESVVVVVVGVVVPCY